MSIESSMFTPLNQKSGKGNERKEIRVTSIEEYLQNVKAHPFKEVDSEERITKVAKVEEQIAAILQKRDVEIWNNHFEEYRKIGLVDEEIGYFPNTEELVTPLPITSAWLENIKAGYNVEIFPVHNDKGEYIGDKLFRFKRDLMDEEKAQAKIIADNKWLREQETEDILYYREQEKDRIYREKVKSGELIYLGEMSFDEFGKFIRDNADDIVGLERQTEIVWLYDGNKERIEDRIRCYAPVPLFQAI